MLEILTMGLPLCHRNVDVAGVLIPHTLGMLFLWPRAAEPIKS